MATKSPAPSKTVQLHAAQNAFLHSDAIFRAFCGGIGSGKSWAGSYDLIKRAKPGRLYLVCSPTYTMLCDSTFRSFLAVAQQLGVLNPKDVKRSPPAVKLRTGAEVIFRSADDPDKLYGPNVSGCWLDEASLMPQDVFNVAIGRLREAGEQGWLSATFTPKGLSHWTHTVFNTGRPNTALIRCRTQDNVFLPSTFHDNVASQYTSRMRLQELEGEFLAGVEGALFQRAWLPIVEAAPPMRKIVRAWDCASTPKNERDSHDPDYTCGLKMGLAQGGGFYVLDLIRLRGTPQQVQAKVRAAAEADGRQVHVVMEQEPGSSGVAIVDFFLRLLAGFAFKGVRSTGSKVDRAMPLAAQAEGKNVKLLRGQWNEELLSEFESFPYGRHDDICDSASLAFSRLMTMKRLWMHIDGVTLDSEQSPVVGTNGVSVEQTAMGRVTTVRMPQEHGSIDIRPDAPGWQHLG